MCDYSLHSVKSRRAKVGDKLTTRDFGTGTRGFAASEDVNVAVCVLPGTELSFSQEVTCLPTSGLSIGTKEQIQFDRGSVWVRDLGPPPPPPPVHFRG
jgi:hypothetical protein